MAIRIKKQRQNIFRPLHEDAPMNGTAQLPAQLSALQPALQTLALQPALQQSLQQALLPALQQSLQPALQTQLATLNTTAQLPTQLQLQKPVLTAFKEQYYKGVASLFGDGKLDDKNILADNTIPQDLKANISNARKQFLDNVLKLNYTEASKVLTNFFTLLTLIELNALQLQQALPTLQQGQLTAQLPAQLQSAQLPTLQALPQAAAQVNESFGQILSKNINRANFGKALYEAAKEYSHI